MRNTLIRILQALVIVVVASSFAHAFEFVHLKKKAAGGGSTVCDPYLICQDLETATTGFDNVGGKGGAWTKVEPVNSVVTPAYTTAPLAGSQSLWIDYNAYGLTAGAWTAFAAQDNVYAYTMYRTTVNASASQILRIQDSAGTDLCRVQESGAALLTVFCSANASAVTAVSVNTVYHVWLEYEKGTGVNGVCRAAFSTDGTKPSSGDNFVAATSCTQTAQGARLYVGGGGNDNAMEKKIDKIRVKTTAIGSNPD